MRLKGSDISISVGGTLLALCRECNIEVDRDMKETASTDSSDARTFIPGRYSWSIDSAHLVGNMNQNTLLGYILQGTELSISIKTITSVGSSDAFSMSGSAYLKNFKMGAPLHGLATANCSFQGTGTLTSA